MSDLLQFVLDLRKWGLNKVFVYEMYCKHDYLAK